MEEVKMYTIVDTDEDEIVHRFSTDPKKVWDYMKEIESDTWEGGMVVIEMSISYDVIAELFDNVYHRDTDIDYVISLVKPYRLEEAVWTPENRGGV